jgi:hypothetical protein
VGECGEEEEQEEAGKRRHLPKHHGQSAVLSRPVLSDQQPVLYGQGPAVPTRRVQPNHREWQTLSTRGVRGDIHKVCGTEDARQSPASSLAKKLYVPPMAGRAYGTLHRPLPAATAITFKCEMQRSLDQRLDWALPPLPVAGIPADSKLESVPGPPGGWMTEIPQSYRVELAYEAVIGHLASNEELEEDMKP